MDDFNFHIDSSTDGSARRFLDLIGRLGLVQHVTSPTHRYGHILDLVLTLETDRLVKNCSVSDLISDHFMVVCAVRAHRPIRSTKIIECRSLKRMDFEKFQTEVSALPFVTSPESTVDGLVSQFDGLMSVLDKHAPLRWKKNIIRPDNPWFSTEISAARRDQRKRERAWMKNYRRNGSAYRLPRRVARSGSRFVSLLKHARRRYYRVKINECGSDRRSLQKFLDSKLLKKPRVMLPNRECPIALADEFLQYFNSKPADIRKNLSTLTTSIPFVDVGDEVRLDPECILSQFRAVSEAEVRAIIMASPFKSSELDGLPTPHLKLVLPTLLTSITRLVNISLPSGTFPSTLKLGLIRPLLKNERLDPERLENYRPVSNLSFILKLLERIVLAQLMEHVDAFSRLSPMQSAYRSMHSTETALIRVTNDLLMATDSGCASVLVLLDLSAAFDTVDHDIHLSRIKSRYGICDIAYQWIDSFVTGRSQSVSLVGATSISIPLLHGVPQGSVLDPVFFSLYIDPLCQVAKNHGVKIHLYADDTQLYMAFRLPCTKNKADQRKAESQKLIT